jgi:hypothetical protein
VHQIEFCSEIQLLKGCEIITLRFLHLELVPDPRHLCGFVVALVVILGSFQLSEDCPKFGDYFGASN